MKNWGIKLCAGRLLPALLVMAAGLWPATTWAGDDFDGDGVVDPMDNCPMHPNGPLKPIGPDGKASDNQKNNDEDLQGDACDADDDNDGLTDDTEKQAGTSPLKADSDSDTISDLQEICPQDGPCIEVENGMQKVHPANTDGDMTIDAQDTDSDGDGVSDALEAGDSDLATEPIDSDKDGIPDFREVNSDGDNVPDGKDRCLGEDNTGCPLGHACDTGAKCASGHCVSGICCDTSCAGVCQACSNAGICKPKPFGHLPFDHGCVGGVVSFGACGEDGQLQRQPVNCIPYACNEDGQCNEGKCADHAFCADKFAYCDSITTVCEAKKQANSNCTEDAQCPEDSRCVLGLCSRQDEPSCGADEITFVNSKGEPDDCTPYKCVEAHDGKDADCGRSCESVADCAPDHVCDLKHECVTPPDATEETSCALPVTPFGGRGLEALLVLPAVAALWRRRRGRRGSDQKS